MDSSDPPLTGPSAFATAIRIGLAVLAVIIIVDLVFRLRDTAGLVFLAATIAIVTAPAQRVLTRFVGVGAGRVLTAVITFVVVVAAAVVIWRDLAEQTERLTELVLGGLDDLKDGSFPERLARLTRAEQGVSAVLDRLPSTVVAGEESTAGAGSKIVNLLVAIVLAAFFQAGGPAVVSWFASRWPRDDRGQVRDMLDDIQRRAGAVTRRSLGLAVVAAVGIAVLGTIVDVPGAIILGCWAGAWFVVPAVGPLVGAAPVIGLAWATGIDAGVVVTIGAAVVVVLAVGARKRWIEPVMRLPVTAWILSIGVGILVAGPGGAVVALLLVSVVVARLTQNVPIPPRERTAEPIRLFDVDDDSVRLLTTWRQLTAVLAAAASVAALALALTASVRAIVWLVVAAMIAVALNRPTSFVQRHMRLSRPWAATGVLVAGVVLISGVTLLGALNASATTSEFSSQLPQAIRDLEELPVVGDWLADRDAAVWLDAQLQDLPQRLAASGDVADRLPYVGDRIVDLMWTMLLAVALLIDGPRLAAAVRRRVPATSRRQAVSLSNTAMDAISDYLGGAMTVAAINASVVLVIAASLGLSLAPVLAAWAFIWNFVPQIGGFMGGFPLVVLALTAGPIQAVVAGGVYVSYQFLENHVIQPKVIGGAIDVPPWVTLMAALAGGAMAGLLGAVVLTPLIGVVHLAIRAYRSEDFPGRVAATIEASAALDAS